MNISSIDDLEKITKKIRKKISLGDTIFLYGDVGVGKTTFARLLINNFEKKNLKKKNEILSPTFNILFEYNINNIHIMHYDLYRFNKKKDIKNLGIFENLENSITIVEWPELIDKKPLNRFDLFFRYAKDMDRRFLTIKSNGRLKKYKF
tara:strand:- start:2325 stop:2771 length:447 start_codon:yes stop_codon:yes gene_type:complete